MPDLSTTGLSTEDELRLRVLLTQKPLAIRIDENKLLVQALFEHTQSEIHLHPNSADNKYLKHVRDLLSDSALDIPGGYPTVLNRWNRINQLRHSMIDPLLLIGVPEAVTAAIHADGITTEQARRAWWAHASAENARCLIEIDCVAKSDLGPELASYLLEYLPFETQPEHQLDTATRVLKPGLISDSTRSELWQRAQRNTTLMLGFIKAEPHGLPASGDTHAKLPQCQSALTTLAETGNPVAELMLQTLSVSGQRFIAASRFILAQPADQVIVRQLIDTIAHFFRAARVEGMAQQTVERIRHKCAEGLSASALHPPFAEVLHVAPELRTELLAVRVLSQIDHAIVEPVLANSSATGALMQRKLAAVLDALNDELRVLNDTPLENHKRRTRKSKTSQRDR